MVNEIATALQLDKSILKDAGVEQLMGKASMCLKQQAAELDALPKYSNEEIQYRNAFERTFDLFKSWGLIPKKATYGRYFPRPAA